MTSDESLVALGESTAEAVAGVLGMLAPDGVSHGGVAIVPPEADPLQGIPLPAVVANVSYVDGVTGGNVFVISLAAARRLVAAMMGSEPSEDGELSELELSAVSEAMNQMIAAAAAATSKVLGEEVEIAAPQTRVVESPADAASLCEKTPHATTIGFSIFGEPCRLVQLVPNAFVVRIGRALGEQVGEILGDPVAGDGDGVFDGEVLRDVPVRVWAELGRSRLAVGRAVGLATGSVLELDRAVDDPVDLYVNGRHFGLGRLLLTEDGEWAVELEQVASGSPPLPPRKEGA